MGGQESFRWRRPLAAAISVLVLVLSVISASVPAMADTTAITGTVVDSSDNPQANVAVNVQDPSTASTVASTTTDAEGDFTVPVASGTYNVQFIPPSNSGLQSYLATGASTDGPPLTVVLKTAAVVQVQGTLEDSEGNVYTSAQGAGVSFSSPLNPGSTVYVNGSGGFSADVFDDQNFSVVAFGESSAGELQFTLPVGTLDQDETYNVVMPVSTLTVSVRDASGNPVTGGGVYFQNSFVSPLPGLPGSSGSIYNSRDTALDANGNASLVVPNGITLQDLAIHLSNGLVLPFTLPAINGDQHVFLIFNAGTLIVDQPPVVTGTPDRPANADGWYNAPVTITWTSTSPAGSPGPPTTPPPTTVSAEGANQVITSAPSCDPAGDCATGTVTGINLDMTPPSVSVTGVTGGATYSQAPSAGCTTSDSLSGVATNATISVTNSGTSYTATCSAATDNAGNQAAPVSVTYQVIPAGWTTASLSDSNGNPISGAAVVFRSASGSVTNATTGSNGIAGVTLTPGNYSVAMYYANGYQTKTISVTAAGPNAVSFATVPVTVQINDPDSADLAAASIAQAGNTGTFGPKTAVNGSGQVTFQVLPGTNSFTAYDANGYQTQTVTVTGPGIVTFATVAVTVTVLKNGAPLTTASVAHAGNTGAFGPKTPVDSNGQVIFQVLPGTNSFTAWDGSAYTTQTLTITATAGTSISVS